MILRHWPSACTWLWTSFTLFELAPFGAHQLEADRQEVLAHDVKPRARQQMMDVGDAAGDRVLDRDHGERGRAIGDRREGVLEGRRGQRLPVGIDLRAGDVGVGAGLPLIGDGLLSVTGFLRQAQRALEHGAGALQVFGGVDAERHVVDEHDVDAHSRLERPQLLELFPHLERRRRQRHKALERRAPIGIQPDVMEKRPRPAGRGGAREIERPQAPG